MEAPFSIIEKEGFYAIDNKNSSIAVILYTLDENDLLDKIGAVTEKNPHFPGGFYTGMVMGTVEADDTSLLARAKAEAMEEAGYDITENTRWDFLGEIYASKLFPDSINCFCADVTGLASIAPRGDGSSQEKGISFKLLTLKEVQKLPDSIFQACFFKLFSKLYKTQLV